MGKIDAVLQLASSVRKAHKKFVKKREKKGEVAPEFTFRDMVNDTALAWRASTPEHKAALDILSCDTRPFPTAIIPTDAVSEYVTKTIKETLPKQIKFKLPHRKKKSWHRRQHTEAMNADSEVAMNEESRRLVSYLAKELLQQQQAILAIRATHSQSCPKSRLDSSNSELDQIVPRKIDVEESE